LPLSWPAHILAATRCKHHVPLRNVRNAIIHLQKPYPTSRPLLSKDFYTDGLDLFIKNMTDTENISKQGQLGLKPILDLFLQRIEFDDEFRPKKVWPLVKGQSEGDKVISMVFGVSAEGFAEFSVRGRMTRVWNPPSPQRSVRILTWREMGRRCIFCKKDASSSRSLEHIIPQSLGNEEHALPLGWSATLATTISQAQSSNRFWNPDIL
jgi:hypothetical protein